MKWWNKGCIYLAYIALISKNSNAELIPAKNFTSRDYFAVESHLSAAELSKLHPDWTFEHLVRGLDNHYVFSVAKSENEDDIDSGNSLRKRAIENEDHILSSEFLTPSNKLQKRMPVPAPPLDSSMLPIQEIKDKIGINDPLFPKQWHLLNPAFPGNDINVKDVWLQNITGKGVVAAIIDDGVDYTSPDLKDNFCKEGSWDFNENQQLPMPLLSDDNHGTRCAGEIAAIRNNNYCGVGVAYDAKVSGIRILSGPLTAEDEAASLVHALDVNDIYSCSWGPTDDGKHLQGPSPLVKKAMKKGVTEGRGNKGAIYVFASGNGGMHGDNCNYDGYTNSIYSITVGAIDHKGLHPPYSESCSAVLVVTYSSGSGEYIHSTDINGGCYDRHGGTSAAAPIAAGIYALVLEANPNITWRDMQYLSILSSETIENNLEDGDWQTTKLEKKYSHKYGYGKLNAHNIVALAKDWENVNPQVEFATDIKEVNEETDKEDKPIESTIEITASDLEKAKFRSVEHVTINVDISTENRGTTTIDLISPFGVVSHLGVVRRKDDSNEGFRDWTFMSVAHWGELGSGEWKLIVKTTSDDDKVEFHSWSITLFGLSEYSEQKLKEGDIPSENDDDNRKEDGPETDNNNVTEETGSDQQPETENPENDGDNGTDKNTGHHMTPTIPTGVHLIVSIFIIGCVFLLLHFMFFVRTRRRIKRVRASNYDYDVIDTDAEYDSTNESSSTPLPDTFRLSDIDDNEFDISDEENTQYNHLFNNDESLDQRLLDSDNPEQNPTGEQAQTHSSDT